MASQLDMINSEYIYIFTLTLQGFGHLPLVVDTGLPNDNVTFEAYKRLVVLTFEIPDFKALSWLIDAAADIANKTYKHPFTAEDKYSELTLTIPEMIFSVAIALNSSTVPLENLTSQQFHDAVINREFPSDLRRVVIASNGMRLANTIFLKLNVTSRNFEPAWFYDPVAQNFSKTSALADQWFDPTGPPLNQPKCGFLRDRCLQSQDLLPTIIGSICGGLLGCFCIVAASITFMKWISVRNEGKWWKLAYDSVLLPTDMLVADPKESLQLALYLGDRVLVRMETVEALDPTAEFNNPTLKILRQLRDMRHDNVGQFRGLASQSHLFCIIWEGGRGSLRSAFSNDAVMSEESIKVHFMYNVILGLRYIHLNSNVEAHGSLSTATVILDNRFTAKLCDVTSILLINQCTKTSKIGSVAFVSKPDDIYCLGKVILEILRGKHLESGEELFLDMFKINNKMFLSDVRETLKLCFRDNPLERPTIKALYQKLERFRPKGTVVDNLLHGLQRHAENLEDIVARRTVELLSERRRVDDLLAEIIPKPFIARMRDQRIPPAETFDSATICFSSMVGFDDLCRSKQPVEVCAFLNELYNFLDLQVAGFDVYKVETIKDGYVVASGLPLRNNDQHGFEIAAMSLHILNSNTPGNFKTFLPIRIGIHTGPIAAGFVGIRMPRYCLFGDTMNTASRMESHGDASKIHISSSTKTLLDNSGQFCLEPRGLINVKGKGLVDTYWLTGQTMVLR
ncbi:atrial natriuretic peptide receptor 1-like [Paramacrobiotus metropolitanus]|uniref:atrial natriuretic peptide receptor 1-like n=1 Tax=Paramacrobiotus metropolitanus TaxID=2943436 RepID=UPI002445F0E2|nr:atrial natriuretic peptide receptor 1-like [Paramacrobiotus metropolitanus]